MQVALTKKLVLLDVQAKNQEDVLRYAASRLEDEGFVKPSYKEAVIAREKVFATGLPTVMGGVAIPHTDGEHVIQSAILIAKLHEPVSFRVMGDTEASIPVDCIFMLAMKEAHAQLELLQNLMGILQDASALRKVKQGTSAEEIATFVRQRLAQERI